MNVRTHWRDRNTVFTHEWWETTDIHGEEVKEEFDLLFFINANYPRNTLGKSVYFVLNKFSGEVNNCLCQTFSLLAISVIHSSTPIAISWNIWKGVVCFPSYAIFVTWNKLYLRYFWKVSVSSSLKPVMCSILNKGKHYTEGNQVYASSAWELSTCPRQLHLKIFVDDRIASSRSMSALWCYFNFSITSGAWKRVEHMYVKSRDPSMRCHAWTWISTSNRQP